MNAINQLKSSVADQQEELARHSNWAIDEAYKLGQSEDVSATKAELEETLKHAQEAYEFFKVVMNRFCISENHLESTTKSYLREIGNQLGQIKGIKK
ncbi:hypothetical protein F895_02627 [Acinetobacter sp. CIP 64.2]|uniref:hypothetical protein n=1 Tax=Acinetobacter TaxID=469 RepID=UPI0002882988|nr:MULTISPECIES: hypothetical protein [Acinetobacter]ENX13323.1 hypothetical protein F895_02627 [Acinetobacter sp. CIP 64.2]